eukprot:PhM_4_TR15663/c1_g1_i2/m.21264
MSSHIFIVDVWGMILPFLEARDGATLMRTSRPVATALVSNLFGDGASSVLLRHLWGRSRIISFFTNHITEKDFNDKLLLGAGRDDGFVHCTYSDAVLRASTFVNIVQPPSTFSSLLWQIADELFSASQLILSTVREKDKLPQRLWRNSEGSCVYPAWVLNAQIKATLRRFKLYLWDGCVSGDEPGYSTPLWCVALLAGMHSAVQFLVASGVVHPYARIIQADVGWDLAVFAAASGADDVLAEVLKKTKDGDVSSPRIYRNYCRNVQCLKVLCDFVPNAAKVMETVSLEDERRSVLFFLRDAESVRFVLEQFRNVNISQRCAAGWTAAHHALLRGELNVFHELVSNGCPFEPELRACATTSYCEANATVLHGLAPYPEIVEELLLWQERLTKATRDEIINQTDVHGLTPLHLALSLYFSAKAAVEEENCARLKQSITLLEQHGAKVLSPLACGFGFGSCYYLNQGATKSLLLAAYEAHETRHSPHPENKDGETYGWIERLCRDYGVDINAEFPDCGHFVSYLLTLYPEAHATEFVKHFGGRKHDIFHLNSNNSHNINTLCRCVLFGSTVLVTTSTMALRSHKTHFLHAVLRCTDLLYDITTQHFISFFAALFALRAPGSSNSHIILNEKKSNDQHQGHRGHIDVATKCRQLVGSSLKNSILVLSKTSQSSSIQKKGKEVDTLRERFLLLNKTLRSKSAKEKMSSFSKSNSDNMTSNLFSSSSGDVWHPSLDQFIT